MPLFFMWEGILSHNDDSQVQEPAPISAEKKLLPANTRPRKMASQLRRRIGDPRGEYRLYKEGYHLYAEANPPETPRTRKDKLKIVFWIVVILLTGVFMFYFASQVPLCTEFGCP